MSKNPEHFFPTHETYHILYYISSKLVALLLVLIGVGLNDN